MRVDVRNIACLGEEATMIIVDKRRSLSSGAKESIGFHANSDGFLILKNKYLRDLAI